MVEIHRIVCGNGNCYIAVEGECAILIDTGRKKYREEVLKKCREFRVKLIVLTHGHLDHCENAAYLSKVLHVPVAMSERDRNLIPDNIKQTLFARTFLGKIVLAVSLKSFEKDNLEGFEPKVFLKEGDSLREYGISAQIIELPGHTDGSIGLLVDKDKLFVGDALMNMFYPTVSMLYTDEKRMLQSAAKISGMGELTIYFGHGKPVRNRVWRRSGHRET